MTFAVDSVLNINYINHSLQTDRTKVLGHASAALHHDGHVAKPPAAIKDTCCLSYDCLCGADWQLSVPPLCGSVA